MTQMGGTFLVVRHHATISRPSAAEHKPLTDHCGPFSIRWWLQPAIGTLAHRWAQDGLSISIPRWSSYNSCINVLFTKQFIHRQCVQTKFMKFPVQIPAYKFYFSCHFSVSSSKYRKAGCHDRAPPPKTTIIIILLYFIHSFRTSTK